MRCCARGRDYRRSFRWRPLDGRAVLWALLPMLILTTPAAGRILPPPVETVRPVFEETATAGSENTVTAVSEETVTTVSEETATTVFDGTVLPVFGEAPAPMFEEAATAVLEATITQVFQGAVTPMFADETPAAVITQRGAVSLDQAIQLASRRYPGRVVRAETTERGGRRVHEIRILVERDGDARMRIVRIDAASGRFL